MKRVIQGHGGAQKQAAHITTIMAANVNKFLSEKKKKTAEESVQNLSADLK